MDSSEESKPLLGAVGGSVNLLDAQNDSEEQNYLNKVQNGKLYLATFAAVLGPLSFGFVLGYSSPAIPDLQRISDPNLRLGNEEASWFGSVVTLGAALGGVIGGWLVDKIGRKLSLMMCSIPFIFGFTFIISAQSIWMLYLGRVLTGLASGVTSLVVPLYISETAHTRVRGALGSCVQLMVVTGIMGAYIAGLVLDWRWLAVVCSLPPALMLVLMCFMPETPRYLLTQNRRAEACVALRFLRGPEVDYEWECRQIEDSSAERGSRLQLQDLQKPEIYKPFIIGVLLMFLQQMTGINAIMFYAQTIFEEANFKNSSVAPVIVAAVQVSLTAVAALIMDRAGRKVLLIISGVTMAISTGVFGVYFKLTAADPSNSSIHGLYLLTTPSPGGSTEGALAWLAMGSMGMFIAAATRAGHRLVWRETSDAAEMKVVLLTVLGALCVLTEGAHILPQKDFDLQRFAGKWHRVGLAYNSDWFRQYRDSLKISVGVLVPTETGSVNVTMWQLKSSGCHSVTFLYEKTDTPGHFTYFSTRSNALKDITIVDTNYDEYALVLKNNPTGNTQVAMYGRKQKLRAELMEKFKAFSQAQGLPEDSIVIPLAAEDCP